MAEIILLSRDTCVHRNTIITSLGTRVFVKIRYRCHVGDTRNREIDRSPVISSCRSSNVLRINVKKLNFVYVVSKWVLEKRTSNDVLI